MKKFFLMMGLWLVAIITIIIGSGFYEKYQTSDYDETAIPYIKKVIPEISTWDPQKARALMAPEISASIPDEDFARAMAWFSRLGALQSMDEPDFDTVHMDQVTSIGKQNIISYDIDAKYVNGEAEINLNLLDRDGSFEIYRFNFTSAVLQE